MTAPDETTRYRPQPSVGLEIASALLVPAAMFGFIRLFADTSVVWPLMLAALISTGVAAVARRLRIPLAISLVISAAGLVLVIARRFASDTLRRGVVPTGDTWEALRLMAEDGIDQFQTLRAPVEAVDGFVAASIAGAWVMAVLTDWGAMRLRLAFEPVLPAALLFIFASTLGSGEYQVLSTLVFAAVVALWAITQRLAGLRERAVWLQSDRRRGPGAVAQRSALIGAIAVIVGIVASPFVPGSSTEPWYSWRNPGDPVREVISPFVSIRAQLAEQSGTRLFTVTADRPAYWRLAGLDAYRDGIWSTRGTFESESGDLPGTLPTAGTTLTNRQEFTIESLSAIWLPAAFAPSRIESSDGNATWNAESSSLSVDNSLETSDGLTYVVESVVPFYSPEELRAAGGPIPPELAERYLALPEDLSPVVAEEADRITAGQSTDYDRMLALQEHFRTFDYSVELSPREGDPVEQFLDEEVGFCQQFAGTFALMARSLGIPARVAVGFTWGDPIDGQPGTYAVSGRQAHAWPEVWFADLGWVAFEPTPGRGAPDAGHNPVEAAQDSLVQPDRPGQPTTTQPSADLPQPTGPDLSFDPALGLPDQDSTSPDDTTTDGGGNPLGWLLGAVIVLAAYIGAAVGFHRWRRARRRSLATTPRQRIELAWAEAAEAIEQATGRVRPAAMTRVEWADSLARQRRVPAAQLRSLAEATTVARYGDDDLTEALAERAETDAAAIREEVIDRMDTGRRFWTQVDPRRLWRPTRRPLADAGDLDERERRDSATTLVDA